MALLPTRIAKSLGADIIIAVDVMGEKQASPNSNALPNQGSSINIQRNHAGISATWGDKTMTAPVNLDKLNQAAKGLPIDIPLGDLLGVVMQSIPTNTIFLYQNRYLPRPPNLLSGLVIWVPI